MEEISGLQITNGGNIRATNNTWKKYQGYKLHMEEISGLQIINGRNIRATNNKWRKYQGYK